MRNPQFVFQNFRTLISPRKPRHPLARLAMGVIGLLLVSVLLLVGLVVGATMLVAGMLMRLFGRDKRPARTGSPHSNGNGNVVDASYTVVSRQTLDQPR